jgi:hypothetical protein
VRQSTPATSPTNFPITPARTTNENGPFGGMRNDKQRRSTRRKLVPVPICPPQTPHYLTWDRTRDVAVGSRQLTVCAMARPTFNLTSWHKKICSFQKHWNRYGIKLLQYFYSFYTWRYKYKEKIELYQAKWKTTLKHTLSDVDMVFYITQFITGCNLKFEHQWDTDRQTHTHTLAVQIQVYLWNTHTQKPNPKPGGPLEPYLSE